MAIDDITDEYFTYEARLASFQIAQPISKRRASNASSKASKSMKWPHKSPTAEKLAIAGFFYYPTQANPDNCACFLCHKSMDGWEEDDDPLAEHLKHCPDCGWAIVASIEQQDAELSQEYPGSERMIDARKATFGSKWPHEGKKGWKCKVKQMVDAGWKYTPSPEYDDMATCTYCELALDGWEPADKPMDEHYKRSPECAFFILTNEYNQEAITKNPKSKRMSKVSRLSTQSILTVASEAPSFTDLPAEEDDSILTTETNATITKKMPKGKKATTAKARKTKAKKEEPSEVEPAPEPKDDEFEVKVDITPKIARGRKRKSEYEEDVVMAEDVAPAPKRRVTRTRNSSAIEDSMILDDPSTEVSKPVGRKGRQSKSTRKTSTASRAPLRSASPDDEELNNALETDLERPLTDDEAQPEPASTFKKSTRHDRPMNLDRAMFDTTPTEIDETVIEAEIEAMEIISKPHSKAKGAKGKQPRKVSAKRQALAAKKAAEVEAQRLAEEEEAEEAAQQTASELDHSISIQHSSPIIQPKNQRALRQPAKSRAGRATKGSVMSAVEDNPPVGGETSMLDVAREDSGNETDASMASQSTVVRGRATRRGSNLKKTRAGKKVVKNIEKIVHRAETPVIEDEPEVAVSSSPKGKGVSYTEGIDEDVDEQMKEDIQEYIQEGLQEEIQEEIHENIHVEEEIQDSEPEPFEEPEILPPTPKPTKAKAAKSRGRRAKIATASPDPIKSDVVESVEKEGELVQPAPVQQRASSPPSLSSPPPKDLTPSQSPQSSDAENHPPSSKPSNSTKKTMTPQSHSQRAAPVSMASTPQTTSPSKRNVIAGLKSTHPWREADLDTVFIQTPAAGNENAGDLFGTTVAEKIKSGEMALTSPEKKMSVEEWIRYNAQVAEERLRSECERMVGAFEREGTRAMAALEGVECVE